LTKCLCCQKKCPRGSDLAREPRFGDPDVTTIVTIGRKVRFHHTLTFMRNQRGSSAAGTSRLHQEFGIIDTSIATSHILTSGFLRRFRDAIRVPRIENRVYRFRQNHHRDPRIRENRVPRIREVGSLQVHTG